MYKFALLFLEACCSVRTDLSCCIVVEACRNFEGVAIALDTICLAVWHANVSLS